MSANILYSKKKCQTNKSANKFKRNIENKSLIKELREEDNNSKTRYFVAKEVKRKVCVYRDKNNKQHLHHTVLFAMLSRTLEKLPEVAHTTNLYRGSFYKELSQRLQKEALLPLGGNTVFKIEELLPVLENWTSDLSAKQLQIEEKILELTS